jgi:hypothetical protein
MLSSERFSELVGSVFDYVIDTDRWPIVMGENCSDIDCGAAAIMLIDLQHSRHHLLGHRISNLTGRLLRNGTTTI